MSEPILEAYGLRRHYEEGRIVALDGVDLKIERGEFVSISGPSGSGKSTLLQLLGGLDVPTSGKVLYKSKTLGEEISLDLYRLNHVGFIFQAFHLLPALSAIENVQVPWLGASGNRKGNDEKAKALLVEMGLEQRTDQYPGQLSAGERQRVAIARSLANDPEILLADEPTGNLDSANAANIMAILRGLQKKRGMTLAVVTHEESIAESASRHIRMRDGRIVS